MEKIQNENCTTCENVIEHRGESICEVFNLSIIVYKENSMKYGCNVYSKDVEKMSELPLTKKIDGRDYVLYDTQYSEDNAQFAAGIILGRVPKSDPHVVMLHPEGENPFWGVYVKEDMSDD
jgi:hypothetical protein